MSVSSITSDLNASIMLYGNTVINNFMTQPCYICDSSGYWQLLKTPVRGWGGLYSTWKGSCLRAFVILFSGTLGMILLNSTMETRLLGVLGLDHPKQVMELEETVWSTSVQHRLYTLMYTSSQWQGGWQTVSSCRCTVSIIVAGVQVACLDRHAYRCYTPPPAMS